MAKIGRNDPCPCGSGNKYKRCCGLKRQTTPTAATAPPPTETTLSAAVEEIIGAASAGQQKVRELGVFVLVSTAEGDAWLLEITQSIASSWRTEGNPVPFPSMKLHMPSRLSGATGLLFGARAWK